MGRVLVPAMHLQSLCPMPGWGNCRTIQEVLVLHDPSVALSQLLMGCSCPSACGFPGVLTPEENTMEQDTSRVTDKWRVGGSS